MQISLSISFSSYPKIVLIFTEIISCGNGILAPSCSVCPKPKHLEIDDWCRGDCAVDKSDGLCQDKGMVDNKI